MLLQGYFGVQGLRLGFELSGFGVHGCGVIQFWARLTCLGDYNCYGCDDYGPVLLMIRLIIIIRMMAVYWEQSVPQYALKCPFWYPSISRYGNLYSPLLVMLLVPLTATLTVACFVLPNPRHP